MHNETKTCQSDFPWFGIDIGGTLVKLVYFEPLDLTDEEEIKEGEILRTIRYYLVGNTAYGETGVRDVDLEIKSTRIGNRLGNLHFIRFPTSKMVKFVELCVKKNLHQLTFQVYATGGGAYKFEKLVSESLKIEWIKCDELEMLTHGVEFMNHLNVENECHYFKILPDEASVKYKNFESDFEYSGIPLHKSSFIEQNFEFTNTYPYILVNIGSGVSILLVKSDTDFKRVSGSSIGGGTFLGLCCLLTGCSTYEEAIDLATRGDNTKVDKLVQNIYGGDYSRFGLTADIVASSFGLMNLKEKREKANREDLAKATLLTVLNNIGLLARETALNYNCEKVLFVGNFLKHNNLSKHLLTHALDYWTKGAIKALFLKHEGYFAALGCLKKFVCPLQ